MALAVKMAVGYGACNSSSIRTPLISHEPRHVNGFIHKRHTAVRSVRPVGEPRPCKYSLNVPTCPIQLLQPRGRSRTVSLLSPSVFVLPPLSRLVRYMIMTGRPAIVLLNMKSADSLFCADNNYFDAFQSLSRICCE
ncbi:hypothetical protein GDO78_010142 [Eleutherodactylus coqui]|uniref:Uncharacterized protein n=1 Tax=Eleutherodactylus coqui TaxID=57060 RepID=A0A8J6FBQ2_ELECQ|nr:hypothetical protein GDO78_010142 [Eleutherodactylus coqui]